MTYPYPHPPCSSSRVCFTKYLVTEGGVIEPRKQELPPLRIEANTNAQTIRLTSLLPLLAFGAALVAVAGFMVVSVMVIAFFRIRLVERKLEQGCKNPKRNNV